MKNPLVLASLIAATLFSGLTAQESEAADFSLMVCSQAGWMRLRDGVPDSAASDAFATVLSRATIRGSSSHASFSTEAWASLDAFTGSWTLSLTEAWAEFRPKDSIGLRVGRFRTAFGPGLAFSPANSICPRDPLMPPQSCLGSDGARAELSIGRIESLSVLAQAEWLLPSSSFAGLSSTAEWPPDIGEGAALGHISITLPSVGILGETEFGASTEFLSAGTEARRSSAGAWLSMELGGFVIGVEGVHRGNGFNAGFDSAQTEQTEQTEAEIAWAFTVNRKIADFLTLVEALWSSADDGWTAFGKFVWTGEDGGASATAIWDFPASSGRFVAEAAWYASESVIARIRASWNSAPEAWRMPGPLASVAAVSIGADWYY